MEDTDITNDMKKETGFTLQIVTNGKTFVKFM